ncbi:MAG: hypothetical protein K2X93_00285 [Candidatus Obscuribacterales bacterium]|nr:hypothetical protein [Candidatus Obscuribacterales bacterium]
MRTEEVTPTTAPENTQSSSTLNQSNARFRLQEDFQSSLKTQDHKSQKTNCTNDEKANLEKTENKTDPVGDQGKEEGSKDDPRAQLQKIRDEWAKATPKNVNALIEKTGSLEFSDVFKSNPYKVAMLQKSGMEVKSEVSKPTEPGNEHFEVKNTSTLKPTQTQNPTVKLPDHKMMFDKPTETQKEVLEGNKISEKDLSTDKVKKDYSDTLQKSGMSKTDADKLTEDTYKRLSSLDPKHLDGSPEQQMARMNRAFDEMLKGKSGPLSETDRANAVKDLAHRVADPGKYGNQGRHNTCALQSLQTQMLQAGDPARLVEHISSVANLGYANMKDGDVTRKVEVDARSLIPDEESRENFDTNFHGTKGKRGMGGHIGDALLGQMVADNKTLEEFGENSDQRYIYLAGNADQLGGPNDHGHTGEGLFLKSKNADGSNKYDFIKDSPGVSFRELAILNKQTGNQGGLFLHEGVAKGWDPPKDLNVHIFKDEKDLKQQLKQFQKDTGKMGQVGVNAPFLPGGGENGHGAHAMLFGVNKDGSFIAKNSWGAKHNFSSLSDEALAKATDPSKWVVKRGALGPAPGYKTVLGPGEGGGTYPYNNEKFNKQNFEDKDKIQRDNEERQRKSDQTAKEEDGGGQYQKEQMAWGQYLEALSLWNARGGEKSNLPKPILAIFSNV